MRTLAQLTGKLVSFFKFILFSDSRLLLVYHLSSALSSFSSCRLSGNRLLIWRNSAQKELRKQLNTTERKLRMTRLKINQVNNSKKYRMNICSLPTTWNVPATFLQASYRRYYSSFIPAAERNQRYFLLFYS